MRLVETGGRELPVDRDAMSSSDLGGPAAAPTDRFERRARLIADLAVLAALVILAIFIALSPSVVYQPVPRVIVFMLIAIATGLALGRQVTGSLQISGGWATATFGGIVAVVFGAFFLLTRAATPDLNVRVYEVTDGGQPVGLHGAGVLEVRSTTDTPVDHCATGDKLFVLFPSSAPSARVHVSWRGRRHSGIVDAAAPVRTLRIGDELQ
jgi:hypothetical protein